MALRLSPDPELVPLLKAIRARLDGLGIASSGPKDGLETFANEKIVFLQLEVRRDHMLLDLWLTGEALDEARASGIARAHPFLGDDAVKVRFERAQDLARVARWIEAAHDYAPTRPKKISKKVDITSDRPLATPPPPAKETRSGPIVPAGFSSGPTRSALPPKLGAQVAAKAAAKKVVVAPPAVEKRVRAPVSRVKVAPKAAAPAKPAKRAP